MGNFKLSDLTQERVRSQSITPELMGAFFLRMADQHGDDLGKPDPYIAAFFAFAEASNRKPGKTSRPLTLEGHATIAGVVNRGFALAELAKAGHLNNWTINKSDHAMMHPALVHAAAVTSLKGAGEEYYFDPPEFLMNALAAAPANEPFSRS